MLENEVFMSHETMRIGEVAASAGVNVQTLRYYERRGILQEPKRTPSGQRAYSTETVRFIRFIKRAQELGFSLEEVEDLLRLRAAERRDRTRVRQLAAAKVRDIDEKVRYLRAMRRALGVLLESCDCAGQDLACPILEALDDRSSGTPPFAIHTHPRKQKKGGDI